VGVALGVILSGGRGLSGAWPRGHVTSNPNPNPSPSPNPKPNPRSHDS